MKTIIGNNIEFWESVAPQFGSEVYVYDLCVYNGKLYGSTSIGGKLLEWNGVDAWVQVADKLNSQSSVFCLTVFNGKLYGGTSPGGRLFEWNGVDAWVQVGTTGQSDIYSLCVFNNKLYAGTGSNAKLFEWNGVDTLTEVAPQLNSQVGIRSMVVFNNKLYAGTSNGGRLFEWNGTDAFVEVAPQISSQIIIISMVVHNEKIYGSTYSSGLLLEWNGVDAWIIAAPQIATYTGIHSLISFNGSIYGSTSTVGKLYKWNNENAWVEVAPQLYSQTVVYGLTEYNGKIYGGTTPNGNLFVATKTPEKVLIDTLQIDDAIGERTTCSFTVIDEGGIKNFTQSKPVEITDDGVTLFSGFIERSNAKKLRGNSTILHSIYCKDMHYLSDKRIVAKAYTNTAAGTIVTSLITDYLADEGVTAGTIQSGPTLVEAIFNYVSATKALESLAEKAGFIWYIDYDRKLYFMARETVVAPWAATGEKMLDGTVTVENGNYAYRNTQFVRGGKDITDTLTETRIGDGVLNAFTVSFPIALVPTITLNAGAQTVGIRGVDTGKDWYWSKGSNIVSQDEAGTILTSSDSLAIEYKGEFDVIVKTLNEEEITRLINTEASSGIVENVADEGNSTTREAAFEVANSKLQKYGVTGRRLKFSTLDSGLFAGQILTVELPEHAINTDLLIESVSTITEQGTPIYEVTASEGPERQSWQILFANLASKVVNQSIFENITASEVLITLSTFTKTWIESTPVNIFAQPEAGDALLCGSFYPAFEENERVLYMELWDSSDNVIIRKQIIKQSGTTVLNSVNFISPFEANDTIAKIAWFGGPNATATNSSGIKVDEQVYSKVKTSLEALQLDKTDTKGW